MPSINAVGTVLTTGQSLASGEYGFVGSTGAVVVTSGFAVSMQSGSGLAVAGAIVSPSSAVRTTAGGRIEILPCGSLTSLGLNHGLTLK